MVMGMALEAMAVTMPAVAGHPNRREFRGVLTVVGAPSDRPPSGARGHRVMLEAKATERALASLIGMALDYVPGLNGHDARRKVGIITSAELQGPGNRGQGTGSRDQGNSGPRMNADRRGSRMRVVESHPSPQQLLIEGYIFARDFPEVVAEMERLGRAGLGMSYEIADVRVVDTAAPVWVATEFTFTGAAVLKKEKAAYRGTWVELPGPE